MGHKSNPIGLRTGFFENWKSTWYADKLQYAKNLVEDQRVRLFLRKRLKDAGLKEIQLERSPNAVRVKVLVSRPGLVIGRGGAGAEALQKELQRVTSAKLNVDVVEVRDAETCAALVAQSIISQIERRILYKRAILQAIRKALEKGVKGIKVECGGVLSGASSISRREVYLEGSIPAQTLRSEIDFAQEVAMTSYGNIGIKVWIYKGEKKLGK